MAWYDPLLRWSDERQRRRAGVVDRPLPLLIAVDGQGNPVTMAHIRDSIAPRPATTLAEFGSTGTPVSGVVVGADDYNRDLQGKNAVKSYDKMRRGDGQVAACLKLLKLPLLGANWEFIPPENADSLDLEAAAFCNSALLDDDAMADNWGYILRHVLLMLDFGYCVSHDTEALTPSGWKTHEAIAVGDLVLTLNIDTRQSEWQPVRAMNRFGGPHAMRRLQTAAHDSLSTAKHRWFVGRYTHHDAVDAEWTTTARLNTNHIVFRGAPCADLPTGKTFTDAFVELVGWFTTEGQWVESCAALWQKKHRSQIELCLTAGYGPSVASLRDVPGAGGRRTADIGGWRQDDHRDGCVRYSLNSVIAQQLRAVCADDKAVSLDFVLALTRDQLQLFIETVIAGDGSVSATGERVFTQAVSSRLDAVELAATLSGIAVTRWQRTAAGGFNVTPVEQYGLTLCSRLDHRPVAAVRRSAGGEDDWVVHDGIAWCPTTANGTWYARRNGKPFFTGNSVLEKVWTVRESDGRLALHRLAPRLPLSIEAWRLDPATGALSEVVQRAVKDGQEKELVIPAEYAAVFVHEREGDNYNGISVLRPIFKHWYYKDQLYNIDAIGHERFAVGIPVGQMEEGFPRDAKNLAQAEEVLENIRSHHRAYILSPPKMKFSILQTTKENASLLGSIEHHDVLIARSILAPFLNVGQAQFGTRSSTGELIDIFFTALEGIAKNIAADIKVQITKPLCDLNFQMQGRQYPTLVARNIRQVDRVALATLLKDAVGADALTVTDDIENALREVMGWEPLPPELARPLTRATAPAMPPPGGPGGPPASAVDGGGGSEGGASGEPLSAALSARLSGQPARREPTAFEERVFSLADIPRRLDAAVAALVSQIVAVRRQQAVEAVAALARLDAQSAPDQPLSKLRPADFALPMEGDLYGIVRRAQDLVALYGAEQVRLELRRQGAPVSLSLDATEGALLLAETVAEAGIVSRRSAQAQLAASARATADALNAQLRSVLLTETLRVRRSGLRGEGLERAVLEAVAVSAERNVLTPLRGEVNEAFALGRAAEAGRQRSRIAYCVQTAILDNRTCSPCGAADSMTFEFGSDAQVSYQPPYVGCDGRENCRCAQIFVYSGGGD